MRASYGSRNAFYCDHLKKLICDISRSYIFINFIDLNGFKWTGGTHFVVKIIAKTSEKAKKFRLRRIYTTVILVKMRRRRKFEIMGGSGTIFF